MSITDWQTVRMPLFSGVDTKVSGISLPPPKLQVAENCYADKSGQVRKRKGTAAITTTSVDGITSTTSNPAALAAYKDSFLMFDTPSTSTQSWEYSTTGGGMMPRGRTAPGPVLATPIVEGMATRGILKVDCAYAGGYTVYAMAEINNDNGDVAVVMSIVDAAGTMLADRTVIFSSTTASYLTLNVRVVARLTRIYVFFYDGDAAVLKVVIMNTASANNMYLASTGGITPVTVANDIKTTDPQFDIAANATYGVFLAYQTTTASTLKWGFVSTTGVLASTSTYLAAADATSIGVAVASGDAMHGIAFSTTNLNVSAAGNDGYALHRSWSGAAWTATASGGPFQAKNYGLGLVACRYDDATTLRIWFSGDFGTGATLYDDVCRIYTWTYTTGGTSALAHELKKATLSSKPFVGQDGAVYFWAAAGINQSSEYSVQGTHFLWKAATVGNGDLPVAHANIGVAAGNYWLTSVVNPSTGIYNAALPYVARPNYLGALGFYLGTNCGVKAVAWHQSHGQMYATVEEGDSLYLAGGFLQQCDGFEWAEAEVLRYVPTAQTAFGIGKRVDFQPSNTAPGALTNSGVYYYHIIPEITNARGERYQGTDAGADTVTLGAADDTVTIKIPTITATRRGVTSPLGVGTTPNIVFGIYRTLANPSGADAEFYRVGEIANDKSAFYVTFVDTMDDRIAVEREPLVYTSGELDHVAAPGAHIMTSGGNRVFLAGLTDDPHQIRFSLVRAPDQPVAFADENQIQVPQFGGAITALAFMNEALVIFKERAIYRVRGAGPNNLGFGSFLEPELVSADTGAEGQRGVVLSPLGVFFKADKGFYLLTQSYQLDYIGAPLEGLAVGTINGGVLLPAEQQIRFTEASNVWVFDYYHRVWSRYTQQIVSGPSVEYNEAHVWCGTSGVLRETDANKFTAADWRIKFAPLRLPEEMRVRRVGVTGEVTTTANMRIKLYKDHSSTAGQTITSSAIPAGPVLSLHRVAAGMGIAEAMTLEIDDNATGTSGALSINDVVFEVGIRQRSVNRARL